MGLPNVNITVRDGGLGLAADKVTGLHAVIGPVDSAGDLDVNEVAMISDADAASDAGDGMLLGGVLGALLSGARQVVACRCANEGAGTISDVDHEGTGPEIATPTGSPAADHDVVIEITTGGALNTAKFVATIDGIEQEEATLQASQLVAGVTVACTAGSYVKDDTYAFSTTGPAVTVLNLVAAIEALAKSPLSDQISWIHVAQPCGASAWVAMAAAVETYFTATYRYVHLVCEATAPREDETTDHWVARLLAESADVAHARLSVSAGGIVIVNPSTGAEGPIQLASVYCGRLAQISEQRSPGAVIDGALPMALELYPSDLADAHILQLDTTGRFITARRYAGLPGIYVTNGRMMASPTSDYRWVEWRRVMDLACTEVRLAGLRSEHIEYDEAALPAIVADLQAPLNRMVAAGKCTAAEVTVPGGQDVIGTSTLRVKIRIQPKATLRWLELELGLSNPYLNAAQ